MSQSWLSIYHDHLDNLRTIAYDTLASTHMHPTSAGAEHPHRQHHWPQPWWLPCIHVWLRPVNCHRRSQGRTPEREAGVLRHAGRQRDLHIGTCQLARVAGGDAAPDTSDVTPLVPVLGLHRPRTMPLASLLATRPGTLQFTLSNLGSGSDYSRDALVALLSETCLMDGKTRICQYY